MNNRLIVKCIFLLLALNDQDKLDCNIAFESLFFYYQLMTVAKVTSRKRTRSKSDKYYTNCAHSKHLGNNRAVTRKNLNEERSIHVEVYP